jgi:hypothetical protein
MQTMDRSFAATQWKPGDTAGNRVVPERDFGGVSEVTLALLDAAVIERVSFTGCLNECLRHDGRDDQQIASAIHISKGYLSKLLRAVWAAQIKRLIAFMRETKSLAPLQWIAHQMGCELVMRDRRAAEVAELQARLRQLQTGRAA